MQTTDLKILTAPEGAKIDTKKLVEQFESNGFAVVRIGYYQRKDETIYGPHVVEMITDIGYGLAIKNSYDHTTAFRLVVTFGAFQLPTTMDSYLVDFYELEKMVQVAQETNLTSEEVIDFVNRASALRFGTVMTPVQIESVVPETTDKYSVFTEVVGKFLNGANIPGKKKSRRIEDAMRRWAFLEEVNSQPTNKTVETANEPETVEELVIPERPTKFVYEGQNRTIRRPNPKYAEWEELYGDLVK